MQTMLRTDNGNVSLHHRANQNTRNCERQELERSIGIESSLRAPRNVIESRLSNNMANIITHSNIFSNKMKIPKFNVETVLEQCFFLNAELKWSLIVP